MITLSQFGTLLARCCGNALPQGNIVVALSGGVDSMLLTYLLAHLPHKPYKVHAVTIDHLYRPGSSAEAGKVGELVRQWGVNHMVKTLDYSGTDVRDITNFEEVARLKRYEVFREVCKEHNANILFTGHNLNDKLETFVQRLQQNSTLYGLIGIRPYTRFPLTPQDPTEHIRVARPLLDYMKSDIKELAILNEVTWFEDHTNEDIHLTQRNLTRYWMLHNMLSMESVQKVYGQLELFNDIIETKVHLLGEYLNRTDSLSISIPLCSVELKLPLNYFVSDNVMVISRYLYQLLDPLSSVKHYHWMYAKLERSIIPQLIAGYKTVTALNLQFTVVQDSTTTSSIKILISRQNMEKQDTEANTTSLQLNPSVWSKWYLYDRRIWMRTKLDRELGVNITPYRNRLHGRRLRQTFGLTGKTTQYESQPMVTTTQGDIIALPGAQLHHNVYKFVDIEMKYPEYSC